MKKENLIIVHSFPTNSIILKGLIEHLSDYTNVYFIDLPGFNKKMTPLKEISLKNYSKYVDKKIKELKLKSYIISGISFGFWVVNEAKLDKRCKGIMAVEPYINSKSLRMNIFQKIIYQLLSKFIVLFNLGPKIWKSRNFHKIFHIIGRYPTSSIDTVFEQIDPKTFFETAKLIIKNDHKPKIHDLPYVLLINNKDGAIKVKYVSNFFKERVKKLLIIHTRIKHYPKDLSKEYFKDKMPVKMLKEISKFLNK